MTNKKGLTLVELAITITILAILTTIVVLSFSAVRAGTRDGQRETQAKVIANALEKYYEENGEYPGCEALTAEASVVRSNTLKGIDASILTLPKAEQNVSNSIKCKRLSEIATSEDSIAYFGDTSADCQTGPACDKWTIEIRKEDGSVIKIDSRRTATTLANAPNLTVSAKSITSIDASWTEVSGASAYQLQRSTTQGFSSPVISEYTSTTTSATGLTPNTTYYFRVRAKDSTGWNQWSDVKSATTPNITTPSGTLGISASIVQKSARGVASGGSCVSGSSIERQIRVKTNDGSWSAYKATNQHDEPAEEGYRYTFQQRARCSAGGVDSSWKLSGEADTVRPVSQPSGFTISAAMSGSTARGTASGGSCSTGTTIERRIRSAGSATSATGSWSSYQTGNTKDVAANQGWRYTFEVQARCAGQHASSSWRPGSTASTIRPITSTPSTPTLSVSTSGNTTTYTRNSPSCPTGTTTRYSTRYLADWGYDTGWHSPSSGYSSIPWSTTNQGYRYQVQIRAHCYTVHSTGSWSGTGTGSYTRPVSAPTNITWAFSKKTSSPRAVYIKPNGDCGPGATFFGSMVEWSGDINWGSGPNMHKTGWYQDSGYRVNNVYYPSGGANEGTIKYSSGNRWRGKGSFRCKNHVTDRQSGAVSSTSSIWKW